MKQTEIQEELAFACLEYLKTGLSILIEKDKKPPFEGWGKYREKLPSEEEVKGWIESFPNCEGVAFLPGKLSGVEVIDLDTKNDPDISENFEHALGFLDTNLFFKLVIEQTPSGGLHLAYRCSEIGKKENLAFNEEGKPTIELLSEGGKCSVFPSPKYSLVNLGYTEIPEITPDERSILLSVARSLNRKTEIHEDLSAYTLAKEYASSTLTPWTDYDRRGDTIGLLDRHGWRKIGNSGPTTYFVRPEKKERENSASWNAEKRTLFVWSHQTVFPAGKGYSPSAVYAFLECHGDFKEMARRLSEEGYGDRLPSRQTLPIQNGKEIPKLNSTSDRELARKVFAPPKWAVPDLLPEGLTILAGRPKQGKSWMALGLSLSIAHGGIALGSLQVEKGESLYIALEDNERRIQNRMKKINDPTKDFTGRLHFATEFPQLTKGGMEALDTWCNQHPSCRLVVIDTLARIMPRSNGNADKYQEDYDFAGKLQQWAIKRGIALLLIHHLRKAPSDDIFDSISGTTGFTGAADALWVIGPSKRGKSYKNLHITGRDVSSKELTLQFNDGLWSLLGESDENDLSEDRQEILDIIRVDGPLTSSEISERIGKSDGSTRKILFSMKKDQQVTQDNFRGKYMLPE